jgi:uroporphyrinogen decarboxylase
MMTSRERVMAALNHQVPDRVPIDVGGTGLTNINLIAYGRLKKLLGMNEGMARVFHSWIQVPELEKAIADRLHSDTVTLPRHRMCLGVKNEEFKTWNHCGTDFLYPVDYNPIKNDKGDWEWIEHGQMIAKAPGEGTHGFALYQHPLNELGSKQEIDQFFDSYSGNFVGRLHVDDDELKWAVPFAKDLYENTDKCVISDFFGTVLENAQGIVGWDEIYVRMLNEPEIAKYFLERLTETLLEALKRYIPAIRDYVQVLVFADDIGQQQGPMLDPEMYREFLYPLHKKLFRYVRDNSDIRVFFHTDGAVTPLLPHLIDAGIQIFNTVQTDAADMDPGLLKREFGKDLVFWGGGVDTHRTLPRGTPSQVREDVRRRIQILSQDGGYVFSSVHNILSDIEPENIVALFDAAYEFGEYPIQADGQTLDQLQVKHKDYWRDPLTVLKEEGVA